MLLDRLLRVRQDPGLHTLSLCQIDILKKLLKKMQKKEMERNIEISFESVTTATQIEISKWEIFIVVNIKTAKVITRNF